jgi:hypothetical protein
MTAKNQFVVCDAKTDKVTIISLKRLTSDNGINTHHIFVTDEYGISIVFTEIKSKLATNPAGFQTLVYVTARKENPPLFNAELSSLEKRFSHQLEIHYLSWHAYTSPGKEIIQETLEVVINSNLCCVMLFHLVGNVTFVEPVNERLRFLGIKQNQISIQKFNN